ncbi:SIS domain-containing protein [Enemella sp. A6]|uniref:SIS domain-containing protein n=1 Tax=Enemella sp. A6 TaxID=3440152 RepID=UPI003EBE5F92
MTQPTMLDYILDTPGLLRRMPAERAALTGDLVELYRARNPRRLRLVASGSSYHACLAAEPLLRELLNAEVGVVTPHAFTYYHGGLAPDELVLVVSQSGQSTNAIEALRTVRELGGTTVGVTADPTADIAEVCDHVIDYGAGVEEVPYVTRGLAGLTMFLILAAVEISGDASPLPALQQVADTYEDLIGRSRDFVERHNRALTSMGTTYVCSSGPSETLGLEMAMKIAETVHVPSFHYEVEEFIHGPNMQLDPTYTVFFLDPNDASSERVGLVYRAVGEVTDRAFILTADESFVDDPKALVVPEAPDARVLTLAYLPFLQVICHEVSTALGSTRQHPLMDRFREIVASKTDDPFSRPN